MEILSAVTGFPALAFVLAMLVWGWKAFRFMAALLLGVTTGLLTALVTFAVTVRVVGGFDAMQTGGCLHSSPSCRGLLPEDGSARSTNRSPPPCISAIAPGTSPRTPALATPGA
jgi:hypothetical protein